MSGGARGASGYLARRLGFYLLAGWAAMSLNFLIPRMMPVYQATGERPVQPITVIGLE